MKISLKLIIISLVLFSCEKQKSSDQLALEYSKAFVIADGHVDLPYRLSNDFEDVSIRAKIGDMDFVRAQSGGLDAPFMSIYVGKEHQKPGEGSSVNGSGDAYEKALSLIKIVNDLVEQHPQQFALAMTPDDIIKNKNKGLVSLPMGMENGAPIEGDLNKLRDLFIKGIRYITLTHSEWNHLGDSSYDPNKKWNGLSPFGEEAVLEMNKLGIMVDISHVSDKTFYDVIEITKAPVIASHSSVRHFTPGFERNMSDSMIVSLAKNGGVIMINFGSSFITEKANKFQNVIRDSTIAVMISKGIDLKDMEKGKEIYDAVQKRLKYPFATLEDVFNHIDHVVKLVGADHVGLGSDFDGVGDSLPIDLKDVSDYPNLIEKLIKSGYSKEDIEKICGGNLMRVWNKVIKVAESLN